MYFWYVNKNSFANYKFLFNIKKYSKSFIIINIRYYIFIKLLFKKI